MDAAHSIFTSAQQWETFLPSIFSPFTPTSKAPHTHPVREFVYLSTDIIVERYLYWENTIGIAPYFALIYLHFLQCKIFPTNSDTYGQGQGISDSSVLIVIIDKMKYYSTYMWSQLQRSLRPLNSILSDAEISALSLLTTLFFAVLVALYFRSHRPRQRPQWIWIWIWIQLKCVAMPMNISHTKIR